MIANRKMMNWLLALTLLLAAVFPTSVLAATGDVLSIDIEGSGTVLELNVGKTKQLKVWGTIQGSTSKSDLTGAVNWTSTDVGIVKVTNGYLTAVKSGSATITAMYNNSSVSTIELKVVDTYKELSLDYGSEGKYKLGDTNLWVYAKATIDTAAANKADVTDKAEWSSSNASVLTIEKGKITLVGEGTATITAKYSGMTASFKATVSSPYSKLKINRINNGVSSPVENDIELLVGDDPITLQVEPVLAVDKTKSFDASVKATWTSSDSGVATVEEGKVKVLTTGKTTITAEYLGVKAKVDVYVRTKHETIIVTPSTKQVMFIGEQLQVTAGVRDAVNHTAPVTEVAEWTSSNPLLFTVDKGVVTAKAAGSTTLKVSYLGVSKSINITVYPTITKLAMEKTEKTELELLKGESLSVPKVEATKLDEETIDFSKEVVWTSTNDEIAKIEDGKIVSKAAGEVILTAKLPESTVTSPTAVRGTTVTVKLIVKEKVLALVTEVDNVNVIIGEESALPVVSVVWEDGSEAANYTDQIKWTLSGSNAVLKDSASGKVIKGLIKGTATLKGTYSNKVISIPVIIEPKITKIVVEPQNIELNLKKSKSIKVTGYYTNGKTVNLSSKMKWESSNVEVATITSTSVKAVTEGTATLNGSYQGIKVSVKVSVVPKVKTLTVDEKKLVLTPGGVKTVVLTALYDTGKTSAVTGSAAWTSSKPSVAKVTNGKIEAIAKGTTTIRGKFDGKTVTITVKVN